MVSIAAINDWVLDDLVALLVRTAGVGAVRAIVLPTSGANVPN
jgi:hypothetical protein